MPRKFFDRWLKRFPTPYNKDPQSFDIIDFTTTPSPAVMTISNNSLLVITGVSATDLEIKLEGKTVQDVVDEINADIDYAATLLDSNFSEAPAEALVDVLNEDVEV